MTAWAEARRTLGNPALVIGLAGVLALLALGVFGLSLAPRDPNAGASLLFRDLPDGNTTFSVPPTLPDADHWFGTDALGRDLWSRILAGARLTMTVVLAASVVRLGIGFTLGLVTGWYGGPIARAVRVIAAGITAVPQLILAIMLVEVTRRFGVAGFIASLALVGWPEIVEYLNLEVGRAKRQPFIEAAMALGATDRRLITRHLTTTLAPQLLTLAALETGAVLLLLAELGLVGLFLAGATFLVGDIGIVGTLKERAPEWGQMLGSIQFFAMSAQLSTLLPAVFVVLASTAFTLLADGLRAASDPFSARALLPGTFGVLAKALAACLCVSAVGFFAFNVRPSVLTMDEGRALAASTAQSTWPGSAYVAGVARWSSSAHGLDRPEKLTYYFRNDSNEVLRISYLNGDRLAVEVRKYETEDEIDFTTVKPLPAGLISYDQPVARADQSVGAAFRQATPNYLVRAILTWPSDRDAPVYLVTYGTTTRGQLAMRRACCFDAKTGDLVDSLVIPRLDPPWPVPGDCAVSRIIVQQIDRFQGYFVYGNAIAVGTPSNLYFQGDNFVMVTGRAGVPALDRASNAALPDAAASIVNAQPGFTIPGGGVLAFATLRLAEPGCWAMRVSVADAFLEYTVYAYPWECRPARELANPPPSGVVPKPCTAPSR